MPKERKYDTAVAHTYLLVCAMAYDSDLNTWYGSFVFMDTWHVASQLSPTYFGYVVPGTFLVGRVPATLFCRGHDHTKRRVFVTLQLTPVFLAHGGHEHTRRMMASQLTPIGSPLAVTMS